MRVLLIEDNPGDRYLTQLALDELGLPVQLRCIEDGHSAIVALTAIAEAREPAPDLVLLDINLPRASGVEVLQAIAGQERLRGLPIVVLTTSTAGRDREACLRHGAAAYLVKPTEYDDFLAVLRSACALARRGGDACAAGGATTG